MIPLNEAMTLLHSGAFFSDVEPLVAEADREELRHRFCREPGLPNIEARKPKQWVGDECGECGGQLVWRGTCKQCSVCGAGGSCG